MWITTVDRHPELIMPVVRDMREWDRIEIFATQPDDDLDRFAALIPYMGPAAWVAGLEYEPIAVFGAFERFPGMWDMWLFATDSLNKIGKSMTSSVRRVIVPELFAAGARRLECKSMEGHVQAQSWLSLIGARREASHPEYGRGGETFHTYVWSRP